MYFQSVSKVLRLFPEYQHLNWENIYIFLYSRHTFQSLPTNGINKISHWDNQNFNKSLIHDIHGIKKAPVIRGERDIFIFLVVSDQQILLTGMISRKIQYRKLSMQVSCLCIVGLSGFNFVIIERVFII